MRDRAEADPGSGGAALQLLAPRAVLGAGDRPGQRRAIARPAEGEHLAVAAFAHRVVHRIDVRRPDAAPDRHMAIGDPGLLSGGLDLGACRLAVILATGRLLTIIVTP